MFMLKIKGKNLFVNLKVNMIYGMQVINHIIMRNHDKLIYIKNVYIKLITPW